MDFFNVILPKYYFFIFLSIGLLPNLNFGYLMTQYEIKDLEQNDENFNSSIQHWTHSPLLPGVSQVYTNCNGTLLLGGFNVTNNLTGSSFFQRSFSNLPNHTAIYFAMDIWMIDSWDPLDEIKLTFDSKTLSGLKTNVSSFFSLSNICGNDGADVGKIKVTGVVNHTSPSLNFNISGSNDRNSLNASFGVRNINFIFHSNLNSNAAPMCGRASIKLQDHECDCAQGSYKSMMGTCAKCHESCASCFGASEKECYQCQKGYFFNGTSCDYCGEFCPNCDGTAKGILNVDNICKDCRTIEVEYVKPITGGYQYKIYFAPNDCDLDISIVKNNLKLIPRSDSLMPPFTFKITKISRNNFQLLVYLQESNVEHTQLDISLYYLNGVLEIPRKFVSNSFLDVIQEYMTFIQIAILSIIIVSIPGTFLLGSMAPVWLIINSHQFIKYLKYINILLPIQAELLFSLPQPINWSLSSQVLYTTELSDPTNQILYLKNTQLYSLPQKFIEYQETPFFLENGIVILGVNMTLLFCLSVALFLRNATSLKQNYFLKTIKVWLKWNLIGRIFLINGMPLLLAAFLQFEIMDFEQPYPTLCSVFAIFSFFYVLFMILLLCNTLWFRSKEHLIKIEAKRFCGTLYEGLTLEKSPAKYYYLIIFIRGLWLALVIAFLEELPILQITSLVYLNLALLFYLFTRVRFEDSKLDFVNKTKEVLILIGELGMLCLFFETHSVIYYDICGWLVAGSFGLALLFELLYVVFLQAFKIEVIVTNFIKLCREFKTSFQKDKKLTRLRVHRLGRQGNINKPLDLEIDLRNVRK